MSGYRELFHYKELYILEITNPFVKIRMVDKYLKKLGYLLSSAQKNELKKESSIVIGGLWAVESIDIRVYIAPYIKNIMPKKFKEAYRKAKIPPKTRGYFYQEKLEPNINYFIKPQHPV